MDESTARSRHPDSVGEVFVWALLTTLLLVLAPPNGTYAQVATNITPTQTAPLDLGTIVDMVGSTTHITGGTRPGSGTNLFHSFDAFTLGTGDVAHFMNDMQRPTTNIIGRVIGGEVSTIDGTLRTNNPLNAADPMNFGAAHLWLVNPSGLLLGPNARIEVGGSVSMSTANYLRFEGTAALFDMLSSPASLGQLSVAPVAAFGFVGSNPGGITVQGSQFSVTDGQSISLVGGAISIKSGTPVGGTAQPVQLSAPNGTIQLASTASPGEFDVATLQSLPNVDGTSFTSFGSVSLAPGSNIGSGTSIVFIKDGQITLSVNDATLSTSDISSTPPEMDSIFLSPGSSVVTSNPGSGSGSDVQMTAGNLNLDGSAITTENLGDGIGGNITTDVSTLSLANGASINSNNFSFTIGEDGNYMFGIGQGGDLTIQGRAGADSAANSVMLNSGSLISTQTFSSKPGGDVVIAAGDVHLDASRIYTGMSGPGQDGDVHITADSLTLENGATMTTETSFLGKMGGHLLLNVGTLRLMGDEFGGSLIQSLNGPGADLDGDGVTDVSGKGKGGDITIQGVTQGANSAAESVILSGSSGITSDAQSGSGAGGQISIRTTSLDLNDASFIKSSTAAFGTDVDGGGDILVSIQNLRVIDGATITSSTSFIGDAPAVAGGTVTVEGLEGPGSKAGSVRLFGQNTRIDSNSFSGVPGDLTINAETLTITNGAVINTGSGLSGPAGKVSLTADSIAISAGGQIFSRSAVQNAGQVTITADELTLDKGSIVTRTFSEQGGRGGVVVLNGGKVSLTNGASINSQSEIFSTGQAGNITMNNLESLMLSNHAEITSSSTSIRENAGDAGTITITTTGNTVSLASGSSITSSTTGPGNAGQVIVTTPALSLNDATITTSTSGTGNAGGITANAGTLSLTNAAEISSSSTGTMSGAGDAGSVTISASGSFTSNGSKVSTSAENAKGGDILIDAQSVQLSNGTLISASSNAPLLPDGAGNAGNITINSDSNVVMQNSKVTTEASNASGGSIEIDASDAGMIQLINSQVSTSVKGVAGELGASDGGNINIDPQFVILQNSQIIAQANAGSGGAINVIAGVFLADPSSVVSASSQQGPQGTVNIQSPVQNLGEQLTPLSQQFSSAAALLAQRCAARVADGKFSTFVVAGREGLPAEPGGFLASPSLTTELLGAILSGLYPHTPIAAVTGAFPEYDARPIQLAKFGNACR